MGDSALSDTQHYLEKELYDLLKTKSEIFNFIQTSALDGLWYWDIENPEHEWMNPTFWETLGYSPEEMPHTSSSWMNIIHPEDLEVAKEMSAKHFENPNVPYDQVVRYTHKSGKTVWVRCRGIGIRNEEGKVIRMLGAHTDVTEIKEKEELLERCNREAQIGIWRANLLENTIHWSDETKRIHEVEPDFVGKVEDGIDFYHTKEDKQIVRNAIETALKTNEPQRFEACIQTARANLKYVKVLVAPEIKNGEHVGIYGTFQDITEERTLFNKLSQSRKAFKDSFEHAPIGMALIARDGTWIEFNEKVPELLGYSADELKDLTFQKITHPEDLESDLTLLNELIKGKRETYQLTKRYFNKGGAIIHVLLSVSAVRKENGDISYFISQLLDLTETIQSQQALQESNRFKQALLDASIEIAIVSSDLNGYIQSFNTGAENLLGYSQAEVLNKKVPELFFQEAEIKAEMKAFNEVENVIVNPFTLFTEQVKLKGSYTKRWTFEKKDKTLFIGQLTLTPIHSLKEPTGYLGIIIDLTKTVNAEQQAQQELIRSKKLLEVNVEQNERLKNFAQIVSHNLRSHSANIQFIVQDFEENYPEITSEQLFKFLKDASTGLSNTIANLNKIATIHETTEEQLMALHVSDYVKHALASVQPSIANKNISLECDCPLDIYVMGVPAYLDSIILNLLTNSIKYLDPAKPQTVIKVSVKRIENDVFLSVADNGLGIDLRMHQSKIFGLGKTFHRHPEANGVGLFITKNQVEAMGGTISVTSKPTIGTEFTVKLNHE